MSAGRLVGWSVRRLVRPSIANEFQSYKCNECDVFNIINYIMTLKHHTVLHSLHLQLWNSLATNQPTDGRTNRPTDIVTYRAAIAAKNTKIKQGQVVPSMPEASWQISPGGSVMCPARHFTQHINKHQIRVKESHFHIFKQEAPNTVYYSWD